MTTTKKIKSLDQLRSVNESILHQLKLPSACLAYQRQASEPDVVSMTFDERLYAMLEYEVQQRTLKRQKRLLKESGISGALSSIDEIDFSKERNLNQSLLRDLATCNWLNEISQPSVVVTGATGVGKTLLIKTLGKQATLHSHTTYYIRYPQLIEQLQQARIKGQAAELRKTLSSKDLLIIDDFAMGTVTGETMDDLLSVIDARSSVRGTIYASQIKLAGWYEVFGSDPRTEALLDRIQNFSYKINIKGTSMRTKQKLK